MMSRPLLFVGEGFFPHVGSFAYAFTGRFESWRDLPTSTVPFPSLIRCFAGAPLARGPAAPPLFRVSIHLTASSTRAALCPQLRQGLGYWTGALPYPAPQRPSPGLLWSLMGCLLVARNHAGQCGEYITLTSNRKSCRRYHRP
jgi:hypothetical protein